MREDEYLDLSIVIVNWNTKELLSDCLDSIADCLVDVNGDSAEVYVVDNASADESVAMVRSQFPWVKLIENHENQGFSRANNQAIRASKGRHILMLNSDAVLVPGALTSLIDFMEGHPRAGIAGVRLAFPDGSPQFCYGDFPGVWNEFCSLFGLHRWDLSDWDTLNQPKAVDWVSGACLIVRRETLDEIGLLDEDFFFFGEEVDLCYRAKSAGWGVYLIPSAPVIHVRAGSTGKTGERILRLYRGKLQYAQKHGRTFDRSLLKMNIIISTIAKLAFYSFASMVRPENRPSRELWAEVSKSVIKRGAINV